MQAGRPGRGLAALLGLFFCWGVISPTAAMIAPVARAVFRLDYAAASLTASAFFGAYAVCSIPSGALVSRLGAAPAIAISLAAALAGCLLAPVTASALGYPGLLAAIFVVAAGVTLMQVAASPMAAAMGPPQSAAVRLTLCQAVNAVGQLAGSIGAGLLMLPGAELAGDSPARRALLLGHVDRQFLILAGLAASLGVLVWRAWRPLAAAGPKAAEPRMLGAVRSPWALAGAGAIFVYVGAEVAVGAMLVSLLEQRWVLGAPGRTVGLLVGIYWGGAMIGRFLGGAVLTRIRAGAVLAASAAVAAGLCLGVAMFGARLGAGGLGGLVGGAALAIGLFNAVQFPTIFALTLERSAAEPAAVSGLLCAAITGGAAIPPLMGLVADRQGLEAAFLVPMVCYLAIAAFALAPRLARSGLRPAAGPGSPARSGR